ncbi:hypothetical protein KSC_015280 [Ktedonobacter sp. SOSP1-52]|nr:hypothetical protein KSC_015280 [Ktedonobacter sp. SOSP1-52]
MLKHAPTYHCAALRYFTGVCEFLAGIGLLVGIWFPLLATLAALLLIAIMLGALFSHTVRGKDPISELLPAAVFLILALIVLGAHWENLVTLLRA